VAIVDTLLALELLYLVNADVEVPALEVVAVLLIELRQLEEITELALEPTAALGRMLPVLFGDVARVST
jgi:hypothetical protein